MKATILLCSLLIGILHSPAQCKDAEESPIVGTWCWDHIRHDEVITFKPDGTYERTYSLASDKGKPHSDKGTWSMKDGTLTMTSRKKGSSPISWSIQFSGKDRFELDGFLAYDRLP